MGGKKQIYQYIWFFHRALQLSVVIDPRLTCCVTQEKKCHSPIPIYGDNLMAQMQQSVSRDILKHHIAANLSPTTRSEHRGID